MAGRRRIAGRGPIAGEPDGLSLVAARASPLRI